MPSTTELYGYPESDWKTFRQLHDAALERFCKNVLDGIEAFRLDTRRSYHERYLELFRWLGDRDRELASAFNDPKRSQMVRLLAEIRRHGLLEDDEFSRFTPETREKVGYLVTALSR